MIGAALQTSQVARPTNSIRISGSDSVFLNADLQAVNATVGTVYYEEIIVPSISARLGLHAQAYNEVCYHNLRMHINGQASSLTAGSMILAFCSDPSDPIPSGTDAINWARSQAYNSSGKYWENITVSVPHSQMIGPNGGYFKNNVGESVSPRTYSPGFFALIAVSPPNNPTPLEVVLEWDVTLRCPTLNELVSTASVVVLNQNIHLQGSDTADTPLVGQLKTYVETGSRDVTATDFSPPLEPGRHYRLPGGQLTVAGNTGATGAPEEFLVTHISTADGARVYLSRYDGTGFVNLTNQVPKPLIVAAPYWLSGARFVLEDDVGDFQNSLLQPSGLRRRR